MDALRLLGGLTRGTMRRRIPGDAKLAMGMGLLGVAIAAYEHFTQQQKSAPQAGMPPGTPPPGPPPVPGALRASSGPQAAPPSLPDAERQAVTLIRAMAAAASADGAIDPEERSRLLSRRDGAGLGADERAFLERELTTAPVLDEILKDVGSSELAEQVYAVSLLTIRLDTVAERAYLRDLAGRLALQPAAVARLHQMIGVALP